MADKVTSPLKSELQRVLSQYRQEMSEAEKEMRSLGSTLRTSLEQKRIEEIRKTLQQN